MANDPTCQPVCAPNIAGSLSVGPAPTPPTIVPPVPTTASGVDCLGAPVVATAVGVVQSVPHPTAVQLVKLCNPQEYDTTILCAPDGTRVVVVTTYSATGIPTALAYTLTGAPYPGSISALTTCDVDVSASSVLGCAAGVQFVQWIVTSNGVATGQVYYTNAAGAVVAAPAGWTIGACPVLSQERKIYGGGINIASGTLAAAFDPAGNGASWSWGSTAGPQLQSFTVTALRAGTPGSANTVRVRFGATGSEIRLIQGQSFTWSVAQDLGTISEFVDPDFRVDTIGNSAASIAWTEQS